MKRVRCLKAQEGFTLNKLYPISRATAEDSNAYTLLDDFNKNHTVNKEGFLPMKTFKPKPDTSYRGYEDPSRDQCLSEAAGLDFKMPPPVRHITLKATFENAEAESTSKAVQTKLVEDMGSYKNAALFVMRNLPSTIPEEHIKIFINNIETLFGSKWEDMDEFLYGEMIFNAACEATVLNINEFSFVIDSLKNLSDVHLRLVHFFLLKISYSR